MHLGVWPGLVLKKLVEFDDLLQVRQRLLPVGRADLSPPDVDILVLQFSRFLATAAVEQELQMCLQRVGSARRIPDSEEMEGRGHRERVRGVARKAESIGADSDGRGEPAWRA